MSKIGKKTILIPKEVNVSIDLDKLDIKGPYGNKKINLDTKLFDVNINKIMNYQLSLKKWMIILKKCGEQIEVF